MLPIIVEAAANFCQHQIRLPYQIIESDPKKRTLIAYIDIESSHGTHRAYIGCDSNMLQMITEIFLGEEESDEQTLVDMLLETTNMIVGSAKVLAEDSYELSMKIATPFFLSEELSQAEPDILQSIGIENGEMMIGLKRL